MSSRACAAVLLALLVVSSVGALAADEKPARIKCPLCSAEIAPADRVVVTDFRAHADIVYCGLYCALKEMAGKYPASRALAHSPGGADFQSAKTKQIRIIRTGARWAVFPDTAVFLVLPDKDFPPAQRWRVFERQARYMQFLSRHRDLLRYQPHPVRLPELLRLLTPPKP